MESRIDDGRPVRRWTRQEYHRMVDTGILGPEDHVELIEGEILVMSAEGPLASTSTSEQAGDSPARASTAYGFLDENLIRPESRGTVK